MDKTILLKLIKKDIEELNLLVDAMIESEDVNSTLLILTNAKTKSIQDEIFLLDDLKITHNKPLIIPIVEKENVYTAEKLIAEPELKIIEPEPELKPEEVVNNASETNTKENILIPTNTDSTEEMEKVEVVEDSEVLEHIEANTIQPEEIKIQEPPVISIEKEEEKEDIVVETINDKPKKTIGDSYTKATSLNERLANQKTSESKVKGKAITNLKSAIGLNDKFQFIRELFDGNADQLNSTIETLNNFNNFSEAINYLDQNFKWEKNDTSLKFIELLKRRYNV